MVRETVTIQTNLACPEDAKLGGYVASTLDPRAAAEVEEHLAECGACLGRIMELGKRSLTPNIPDCCVVNEVGRGRFGVVYKAWWLTEKPRLVALKVLSCGGGMEEDRFEREIAVLKRIDSPRIVKCHASGSAGDARYYIMDFVEGMHLDEYLATRTYYLSSKLAVFLRVCRAVADAHASGVIHRDLKPRNILIDAAGQPHILDFGICALEKPDWSSGANGAITHPGDVIGTLKYMSPEQAWGGAAGPIDERTDIWALGVMLYEIVTDGGYPYSLASTREKPAHEALLERIRRELPRLPRLDSIPRGRDLEALLERCLAWELDHRISSADRLADDIERYRQGQRTKTRPFWIPHRVRRLAVGAAIRSRWAIFAAFVAMVGMVLSATTIIFDVGWFVTGGEFQGRGGSPGAAVVGQGGARDGILVAGISDATISAVIAYAAAEGIPGVNGNLKTWRAVNGRFMARLAEVGPRGVAWDYYFPSARPGDDEFVAGLRRLDDAGVPVVLGVGMYEEDGTPQISPDIVGPMGDRLRHGALVARDMVERPGEFVLAFRRDDETVIPSLALAMLAGVLHQGAHLDLDWPDRSQSAHMLYQIGGGAYLRERDEIDFTKVFKAGRDDQAVRADDLLACSTFSLERPERWVQRTVPYETLLTCGDDELRALAASKLILVGDLRTPRAGFAGDRHRVRYGASIVESVPGCYLMADALAGLLDRRYMRSLRFLPTTTLAGMLLVATCGCLVSIQLARFKAIAPVRVRHALFALSAVPAIAGLAVVVATTSHVAVHTGMVGFALFAPLTGSMWVEFARNRHRIGERRGRGTDILGFGLSNTITLARRQARSLRETR